MILMNNTLAHRAAASACAGAGR